MDVLIAGGITRSVTVGDPSGEVVTVEVGVVGSPVTLVEVDSVGPRGTQGPPGEQGPVGPEPDLPTLSLLFENGLI